MSHGWGGFRTTDGDVTVGDEAITIHRTPRKFLQGQLSRWHHGDRWQQLKAALAAAGLLLFPLLLAARLYEASGTAVELTALASLCVVLFQLLQFWAKHLRKTSISLSKVEDITLDREDRELTIAHDAGSRLSRGDDDERKWLLSNGALSMLAAGTVETTLALRTTEDVRKARTVLRARGVSRDFEMSDRTRTETEYRFDTEGGVVFCGECGSQVSPSDRNCPACGYALRVERPVGVDSRDPSLEA